jgi:glucose-6-phosphate 1-dehydrogenase
MPPDKSDSLRIMARCDDTECFPVSGGLEPVTLVIFGASGDLTSRKLVPALFDLYLGDALPERFCVVGCARTAMTDDQFRNRLRDALPAAGQPEVDGFLSRLAYRQVDYESASSYQSLAGELRGLDDRFGTDGNRIFYLAVPPSTYATIAQGIGGAGLAVEGEGGNGFSRLVVEKPFGTDLESALALDEKLHGSFSEHQLFRIDHYLAKETVQNVLVFRFANSIFEPVWNRRYIDRVDINATEILGVEHRAGYYEQSGVLRDMFQNHMMQLLALTAMEPPAKYSAHQVQYEKVKVFRALRPLPADRLGEHLVLGQYGPGTIEGEQVPAYRDEPGVDPESRTPTFARMRLFIDNWRWQGVPFYLTSGKRLSGKCTEIVIHFKKVPHSLFSQVLGDEIAANRLTLGIQPHEVIDLTFQTKRPGAQVSLRKVTMHFDYRGRAEQGSAADGAALDAYARALLDCMQGDHMLFWRQDGVEFSWSFLTPVLRQCESGDTGAGGLHFYPAGSQGPEELARLEQVVP